MDAQKVDMFIMTNGSNLPEQKVPFIRSCIIAASLFAVLSSYVLSCLFILPPFTTYLLFTVISIQKMVLYPTCFIGNHRIQIDIFHTLKDIALYIRVHLLQLCDQLLCLQPL